MKRIVSGQADHHIVAVVARVAVAALVGAGCLVPSAQAQGLNTESAVSPVADLAPESGSAAEIERMFWDCDYAATTRSMAPIDAMSCSVATELFQRSAFGGDFGALLTWWREHKAEEHGKRDLEAARHREAPGPEAWL